MKSQYENRTRYYLPRRTYTIIRIDGKAFHTLLRSAEKPYDLNFMDAMDDTTMALCEHIQGVQFGYVQSDEISLLLTDFGTTETAAWFDGNIQKITSVSASIATAHFNVASLRVHLWHSCSNLAYFDSRVFTIPDMVEVYNYFVWRQEDASRNSIQALGQANFSPKELHGKSCGSILAMLNEKGINWSDMPVGFQLGRFFERRVVTTDVEYTHKKTGEVHTIKDAVRHEWLPAPIMPVFTYEPGWLQKRIPKLPCFSG